MRIKPLTFLLILAGGCAAKPQYVTPLPATSFDHWPEHMDRAEQWALRDYWQAEDNKREKAAMRLRMSQSRTNVIKR